MNATHVPCSELDVIYAEKRNAGLVDVKFLHKNLDEGTPEQLEQELVELQNVIKKGQCQDFDLGPLTLKKTGT